mgnify:CR=1 FL=1
MSDIQKTKTREEFIIDIKKWALLDSQLKIVNDKTKKMREMKHMLTKDICDYVKNNNTSNTIGISDGELKIYEKKEYSPLSYSYIQECLENIIKNPDHIDFIIQYLKDHRETKITQDIKRTYTK